MKKYTTPKKYITREDERNLICTYQENKDNTDTFKKQLAEEALEKLIEAHTPYILKIANQEHQNGGKLVEYEDLVQEGKIGLIKAINRFNLNMQSVNPNNQTIVTNQALLTYAHSYIRAEMQTLFHKSSATHIPAHTIRAIQFPDIKNPGCNTPERKALAKQGFRAESLNDFNNPNSSSREKNVKIPPELISSDPTFNDSVKHIYSPEVIKVINLLSPQEWKVISLKYGLVENEEGLITKTPFIAKTLNITPEKVDKIFKRAKRILSQNLTIKINK